MRILLAVLILILSLLCSGPAESSSYKIRKLVVAGGNAPQGGTFTQFDPVANIGKGMILFDALVKKDRPFHGIYMARGSSLSRVVATGSPAPLGGTFIDLSSATLNSRGKVAFVGSVTGGVPQAIYVTGGSSLAKVVAVNDSAPGGGILRELSYVALNDADAVAFIARVEKGKAVRALFLSSGGKVDKVVGAGDRTPVGGRFSQFMSLTLNNRGEMAFEGRVHEGESPSGLFVGSKSAVQKVVAVGDPAPMGGTFKNLTVPLLNEGGDILFWASLEGARVPAGLFLASNGTIEKVAARGEPIPGGGRFSFIGLSYSLNRSGVVAFQAAITGGESSAAIFLARKGSVTPVVRVGDTTPVGGHFTSLVEPEIGPDGTVVFAADVGGGRAASGLFVAVPTEK